MFLTELPLHWPPFYHWQTFGPLFRDLHLMFDKFAKDVLDSTDHLAERIRMIGPDVENVQLKQMQAAANVQSASPGQNVREIHTRVARDRRRHCLPSIG